MPIVARRLLNRLRQNVSPRERRRTEQVLAAARVVLAGTSLFAIWLDPTEPTRYSALAYGLLWGFVGFSVLIAGYLQLRTAGIGARAVVALHLFDIVWPGVISFFTEGPNSPFFLFFVFALLAAAFRWGLHETLATALACWGMLLGQALVLGPLRLWDIEADFETNRFIMRGAYLLIAGVLVGFLSEQEKQLQAANLFTTRLIRELHVGSPLARNLLTALAAIARVFHARSAELYVRDLESGRVFRWTLDHPGVQAAAGWTELSAAETARLPFRGVTALVDARRATALIRSRDGLFTRERFAPEMFPPLAGARSLMLTQQTFGAELDALLVLRDASPGLNRALELRLLEQFLADVGAALYNTYLLRRLRARAGAVERARVARELHDGAIQSLIGMEMSVDVLRREPSLNPAVRVALEDIQGLLRREVMNLRDLMQQLKPPEVEPGMLLGTIAELVDRFGRQTGIHASFVSTVEQPALPPAACRELLRIVQEALTNVRRHAGATRVLVSFSAAEGEWRLAVDDDGCGFPFSGRFTHQALEQARRGPATIKERARAIGATLIVDSRPGRGSRVELALPQEAPADALRR